MYAVVGTAVAAVISLLTELRLRGRLLLTLFFIALTQHPFPDPQASAYTPPSYWGSA